jgi:5'-nucleotidase
MEKRQILLTNDDGIQSPGLWAAAEALSDLGYVTVAAPREQSSGMGRSLPLASDGSIRAETLNVRGKDWTVYAVGGTPAQAVLHGVLEISSRRPDLVVSGINYGENVGDGVSISGTVGAALEGAGLGIPALAVSLEMNSDHFLSYSKEIDFSTAAYFTAYFARLLFEKRFPADVDVIKIDVPCDATRETDWEISRLSRQSYFVPMPPQRKSFEEPGKLDFRVDPNLEKEPHDSDVYVLRGKHKVSVTPLSLDFTSRVDFGDLERLMRSA